ncbi:hypothetical protein TNCV_404241 [Trichonephila clavipes]|nr:hypothetical protein TNCV_404241 [Trichonephila clavipes]
MNQSDCISDDSSEGNSEDVVLPDEVDIFVGNEDEAGTNDTTNEWLDRPGWALAFSRSLFPASLLLARVI